MSSFIIVLVLVSFQVFCDGALGRASVPLRRFSDYSPLFKEYRVEKRTVNQYACVRAHNAKRALHEDTSELVWDAKLAEDAQAWADHLVRLGHMVHSSVPDQGENLYMSWSKASTAATCSQAVQAWYKEIKDYKFDKPGFAHNTGHFTQVVWKGTKAVGVGIATTSEPDNKGFYKSYVVARYFPPGNYVGQFESNVGKRL